MQSSIARILACLYSFTLLAAAAGAADAPPLKITAIFDVTGPFANYGTAQRRALEVAQKALAEGRIDTGRQPLTFAIEDSGSDSAQVINLMQAALTNGTSLIIGPTTSGAAKKADPVAVRGNMPVLAVSNTAEGITEMGPCVFRNSLSEAQFAPDIIARVKRHWHPKTVAIVYGDDDAYSKSVYDLYSAALPAAGIKVVDVETFHKGDIDFKAALTKVQNAKPDLIVYGAALEEGYKLLRQAHDLGIKAHAMTGNGLSSPRLITLAGPGADNLVFGAAWYPEATSSGNAAFVSAYHASFGEDPDPFSAQAYAGVQILAAAVKRSHPSNPAEMCKALLNAGVVDTIVGRFSFSKTRDADAHGFIIQIRNGHFTRFS